MGTLLSIRYIFKSSSSKNNLQKENLEFSLIKFCYAPKMGKIGLAHGEGKHYFFSFSSIFAFKQTKDQILLQVQLFKC